MDITSLSKGQRARIAAVDGKDPALAQKLREIGFAEDDDVEVMYFGPLGGRPICVRLNQTMIALRREEAKAILVTPVDAQTPSAEAAE